MPSYAETNLHNDNERIPFLEGVREVGPGGRGGGWVGEGMGEDHFIRGSVLLQLTV